jgi:hypothetical protein
MPQVPGWCGGSSSIARAGAKEAHRGLIKPLSDQQPAALVVVQAKLLDGHGFSPFAIERFDHAEIIALAADDNDAPASKLGSEEATQK